MDSLLYGHNPAERVVAVHQVSDQTIRLFKRVEGKIVHEDAEFFPFFFLADSSLLYGFPKHHWLKELEGTNYYKFIAAFSRWSEMWEAVQYTLREHNKSRFPKVASWQELKEILVRPDPARQFLAQSGITLFKGMEFEELERVQIAITFSTGNDQPQSKTRVGKQELRGIGIANTRGKAQTFEITKNNKREVIEEVVHFIQELDPDVLEGFDLFSNILPSLLQLAEECETAFTIGRDNSELKYPRNRSLDDFSDIDWLNVQALGRHLIDLRTLAENELSDFNIEKQNNVPFLLRLLGIIVPDRPSPKKENQIKKELHQQLHFLQTLSFSLSPQLFYLTQWCPFNYSMTNHLSAASQVESLLFREYIHRRHSVPKPYEHSSLAPLPAETFYTGIFSDVLHTSLDLLSARIALQEHITPRTDHLNVFGLLVQELFQILSSSIVAQQQKAVKNILEAFPSYLTYTRGLFNDPMRAEQLYILHSAAMEQSVTRFEPFNVKLIHFDSDGFYVQLPDNVVGAANIEKFLERLSADLPYGTTFKAQGMFRKILSYNRRNFILLDEQQRIIIRGSALQHRGMERFLQVLVHRVIECLLTKDVTRIHHTYASAHTQVTHHQWSPTDFCKVETAKESLDVYQQAVATGNRSRTPAMEAAIRAAQFVKAGDKLLYYLAEHDSETDPLAISKLGAEWDPNTPDEDTTLYLKRLQETIEKFQPFFEPPAFDRLISLNELFPFSPDGINIVERKLTPEVTSPKSESDDYGIWLAESE
jgi:DNA polymerase elongation subunit (family B)